MSCIKCGGDMIGDDYTMVLHCENVDDIEGYEPDAGPIYCDFEEEPNDYNATSICSSLGVGMNESRESDTVQLMNRLYWG